MEWSLTIKLIELTPMAMYHFNVVEQNRSNIDTVDSTVTENTNTAMH